MIANGPEFLLVAIDITFVMVILAVLLAFIRLARGPSLPDRVVALDMMTILIVAFCGLFALFSGDSAFLDVAIVMALIGFLATVALARFAERRQAIDDEKDEERTDP
ncbi:MAG: cation:proton antiporter [Rhodobacteraceae bacterium]|jgi:multicomponent Na+:H+ antiporter subunit F|nr:cation:proton antiporter [Paracoccaceae bacterium]